MDNMTPPPLPEEDRNRQSAEVFGYLFYIANDDHSRFVKNLEPATDGRTHLQYCKLQYGVVHPPMTYINCSAFDMLDAVEAFVGALARESPSLYVYTVHPSSVLFRLLHLLELKREDASCRVPGLQSRTVDLVEYYYYPAVLSLSQRETFSPDMVRLWVRPYEEQDDVRKDRYMMAVMRQLAELHHKGVGR